MRFSTRGIPPLVLLLTGVAVAFPLSTKGILLYLDNPVHLAEVWGLAREGGQGWSTQAFCGFPLGLLHSPLWYGLLAGLMRMGLHPEAPYAAILWFAFVAPALSLLHVVRRFIRPLPALLLSYLILVQQPSIVGHESAWGGMWTWYIGMACLILLADQLSQPRRDLRAFVHLAAIIALIGLTHVFALLVAVLLLAVHFFIHLASRPIPIRRILLELGASLLAALASAAYWVPLLLSRDALVLDQLHLPAAKLILRLLLPTDLMLLYLNRPAVRSELFMTDAIPMVVILGAGLIGGALLIRGRRERLPVLGFLLAALVLLLTLFHPGRLMGLFSWRLLYAVRVGLALASIPLLVWIDRSRLISALSINRPILVFLGSVGILLGFWWGHPLRLALPDPDGNEVQEVDSLWEWLRANRDPAWGRLYVQDTFMTPPLGELAQSHILARTQEQTELYQLGAWYGVVPFSTSRWTRGEFGAFFDISERAMESQDGRNILLERASLANVGVAVVSSPTLADRLGPAFIRIHRVGRYTVYRIVGMSNRWVEPITPGLDATVVSYRPGWIDVKVRATQANSRLGICESWHPFWKLHGNPEIRIARSGQGLLRLDGIPLGTSSIQMEWLQPKYPLVCSLIGWLGIAGSFVAITWKRRRRPPALSGYWAKPAAGAATESDPTEMESQGRL